MRATYKRFLITGVPGATKTTLGNYLQEKFSFKHIDLELDENEKDLIARRHEYPNDLAKIKGDIVVTWGFWPDKGNMKTIKIFQKNKFVLFWFDGDREASFNLFVKRIFEEKRDHASQMKAYETQMKEIEKTKIIDGIKPLRLNPFHKGSCREKEAIVRELFAQSESNRSRSESFDIRCILFNKPHK